jgi:hypothetical protein
MVASFRMQLSWNGQRQGTDKDKTTIGREAKIVQGTFDIYRATFGGPEMRANGNTSVTTGY